jgi:DNA-binding transcriptional ArsR family regulator
MSTEAESAARPFGYELDEYVSAESSEQLKALAHELRVAILSLLNERAASTTELAAALDRPKGTIGYHLKVLESAGLVKVVATRQVRALTEKFYGRVARTVVYKGVSGQKSPLSMLREAMEETVIDDDLAMPAFTLRHVRMTEETAAKFWQQVAELSDRFMEAERGGDRVYGFIGGVFPTDLPTLPEGSDA